MFLSFWVRCRSSFNQCLKEALILWHCLLAWNKNCYFVHTFLMVLIKILGILFYLHIKISMSSQYLENLKPMPLLVAETITKKYSNTVIIKSLYITRSSFILGSNQIHKDFLVAYFRRNTRDHIQIFGTGWTKVPYFNGLIFRCKQKPSLINGNPEDMVQFRKMANIFWTTMLNQMSRKRSSATDYRSSLQYFGKIYSRDTSVLTCLKGW